MATPLSNPSVAEPAQQLPGMRWVLLAMLLALHFALIAPPGGDFQRIWLLVHFGLFLLWQPFFAAEVRLEVFSVVLLVSITAAILYFVSGWMIVMWLSILLGILGGKVFTIRPARRGRLFFLAAFSYLVAMLLVWAVPALLLSEKSIPGPVAILARQYLPFLLGVLLVLPLAREEAPRQVFDFFYAMVVFQLVVVLVLGSLALMRYTGDEYFASVALTMVGFGVALFVLAVLWAPRAGFGGLRTYFSRYLLSVGMPFEAWMRRVADLAETEPDAQRFLQLALAEITSFPWVRGGRWQATDGDGMFGDPDGFTTRFNFHELELTFHSVVRLSPALFLHLRLLAQVVAEFHEGKRRENTLRRNAYMQAVHETGAQLTHDIKNILQSLYALTSAAPRGDNGSHEALLQRQLPQLTRRLHATIEKLRAPEVAAADVDADARTWWADVVKRHSGPELAFSATIEDGATVAAALFDSVLENFLDNALVKKARMPTLAIAVHFEARSGVVALRVCDTGAAIPEAVVRKLLHEPIEHADEPGLGIGLYQAARQAKVAGYRIELASNRDGAVCLRLARADGAAPAGSA